MAERSRVAVQRATTHTFVGAQGRRTKDQNQRNLLVQEERSNNNKRPREVANGKQKSNCIERAFKAKNGRAGKTLVGAWWHKALGWVNTGRSKVAFVTILYSFVPLENSFIE